MLTVTVCLHWSCGRRRTISRSRAHDGSGGGREQPGRSSPAGARLTPTSPFDDSEVRDDVDDSTTPTSSDAWPPRSAMRKVKTSSPRATRLESAVHGRDVVAPRP